VRTLILSFRKHTLLPLDDCLYALQTTIPALTRCSLHRCLESMESAARPKWKGTSEEEEVRQLSDWLFPYRPGRGAYGGRQTLSLLRHRPHLQVRLRSTPRTVKALPHASEGILSTERAALIASSTDSPNHPLGKRPSRTNEPTHQGSHRPALPPRHLSTAPKHLVGVIKLDHFGDYQIASAPIPKIPTLMIAESRRAQNPPTSFPTRMLCR
jgi:hypothetical protein